jgi:3-dehydroquinate dehydratase-1
LPLPLLFTLRDKSEGGSFSGTDEQRNKIYSETLDFVDAIDIEASLAESSNNVIQTAHSKNIKVVLSYHNFEKTPELPSLCKTVDKCFEGGADIAKIATMCETKEEAEQLISLTVKYNNIATVGMGKYGPLTRTSAPAFGSILTYAFTDSKDSPVPRQFTIEELKTAWKSAGIRVN